MATGGGAPGFDQASDPADLVMVHPGFRNASSAVIHRFGADPAPPPGHGAARRGSMLGES